MTPALKGLHREDTASEGIETRRQRLDASRPALVFCLDAVALDDCLDVVRDDVAMLGVVEGWTLLLEM